MEGADRCIAHWRAFRTFCPEVRSKDVSPVRAAIVFGEPPAALDELHAMKGDSDAARESK